MPPSTPAVLVDPDTLDQMVLNLVTNARDAIRGEGTVAITARPAAYRPDPDKAELQGVCLTVTDTGIGMSPATLASALEPFFTTKPREEGTGLGLAMVRSLLSQQRGRVDLSSREGRGTVVSVYLPAAHAEWKRPAARRSTGGGGGAGETLLVVEDEPALRRVAERFLTRAGYRVLLASDADEALAMLRRRQAEIRLVLADVMLPGDSAELRRRVEELGDRCRLVVTSGYSFEELRDRVALPSDVPFLAKPWTAQDLLALVRRTLDG